MDLLEAIRLYQLLEFGYRIDDGKSVYAIYLDFAKANDKVLHVRLAKKLKAVRGQELTWNQSRTSR